jgi:glycolate oxidase subunit GlcD
MKLKKFFKSRPHSPFGRVLLPRQILQAEHERLVYSYDASNLRGMPSLVLLPESVQELAACVRVCAEQGLPFVARGAGTNLAGASVAPEGEVVLSLARLEKVLELDSVNRLARAECGVVNLDLQKQAAQHGLLFAPDPASQKASTLGGNISQNSGGPHCFKYGITTHHVASLETVLADGSEARFGNPYGEWPGPDLRGLWLGSEGCLGLVGSAWLRLIPKPEAVRTALFSFPDVRSAVQAVSDIIASGIVPATLELMDRFILEAVEQFKPAGYPAGAGAVLLAEVDGTPEELDEPMARLTGIAQRHGCLEVRTAEDEEARARLWEGRRGAHAAVARLRPSVWVEDGTVPRNRLAEALDRLQEIAQREKLQVGYLFHAGDGNFHPLILFDDRDRAEWEKVRAAGGEMLKACVDLGGTITGEHGVGLDKLPFMEYQFDAMALQVMAEVKKVFDPGNACNPGKMIPPSYVASAKIRQASGRSSQDSSSVLEPSDEAQAAQMVRAAAAESRRLWPVGSGSKARVKAGFGVLKTSKLKRILDFDPDNLTLEAEAGVRLKEAEDLAATRGLRLGLGAGWPETATLGGVVASNDSGPWRVSVRDNLLGLKAVLPDGRFLTVGRKVVKNVAGLDLSKLFVGSKGCFGFCTRLLFRLAVRPQCQTLALYSMPHLDQTHPSLTALRMAGLEPAACSGLSPELAAGMARDLGLPGSSFQTALLVDLEGPTSTESLRRQKLKATLSGLPGLEERFLFEGENREEVWSWLGRQGAGPEDSVWRFWDSAGGLVVLSKDYESEPLRACLHAVTGEFRGFPQSGQSWSALWEGSRELGSRLSVLKGREPGLCWWLGEADVKMALKLKGHFDPDDVFPDLTGF